MFADFSGRYHNQPGRERIDIVTAFINKIRYLFFGPSPFPIQREGAEKVVKLSDGNENRDAVQRRSPTGNQKSVV